MNLPKFNSAPTLSEAKLVRRLHRPRVKLVIHFALGPEGTNIAQASNLWSQANGIQKKTEVVLCKTPEDSLAQARKITEEGAVPLFWTCAVYYRLNEFFFSNPDVFPFLFSYNMPLDNMQLCIQEQEQLVEQDWNDFWEIASHPSPAPLVAGLVNPIIRTTSNSQAAILCATGEVEACITTAQAAALHDLMTVHEFGSPVMVFFAGTTQHGLDVLLG